MNKKRKIRAGRVLAALLMVLALSFGVVLPAGNFSEPVFAASEQAQKTSHIVKIGKSLYYKKDNGKIRKRAGFVWDNGERYYIRKGGRIKRGKSFNKGLYTFRAFKNGVIARGVYYWEGQLNFSDKKGHWKNKKGIYSFGGKSYYVNKSGIVKTNKVFVYKNVAYQAGPDGALTKIVIPENVGTAVIKIARKEVGTLTGVKYWVWYFKTKFIDTDRTPWCGAFVGWCYKEAGQLDKVSGIKNLGYVPSYTSYANKKSKWIKKKKAKPGDIIIFGSSSHVGLVDGISNGYILTIEGNAGPTAAYRSGGAGAVVRKAYPIDSSRVMGIIRTY